MYDHSDSVYKALPTMGARRAGDLAA
jgi:hypothetical protein